MWAGVGSWSSATGFHVGTSGTLRLCGRELNRRVTFVMRLCEQLGVLLMKFTPYGIECPFVKKLNEGRMIVSETLRVAQRLDIDIFNTARQPAMPEMCRRGVTFS